MKALLILISQIVILATAHGAIQPLPLRNERQSFCGPERFKAKEHSSCGVQRYNKKASSACGVLRHKARADMSCPGSITRDEYREQESGSCNGSASRTKGCRSGYHEVDYSEEEKRCREGGPPPDWDYYTNVVKRTRVCRRDAAPATCRKKAFGPETFKTCEDSSHGVKTHKTCRKKAFGVDRHKSCQFYLTPLEAKAYLDQNKDIIPLMWTNLVTHQGNYFASSNNQQSLFCTIQRHESSPLLEGIVNGLMDLYEASFGEEYLPRDDDSCDAIVVNDINSPDCEDDDNSVQCRTAKAYKNVKNWFEVRQTDVSHLINDIGARKSSTLKKSFLKMEESLETPMN